MLFNKDKIFQSTGSKGAQHNSNRSNDHSSTKMAQDSGWGMKTLSLADGRGLT